jgi:hypothetical protein
MSGNGSGFCSVTFTAPLVGTVSITGDADGPGCNPCNATGQSNTPLPVEYTKFKAVVTGKETNLIWSTASENNNEKFVVERSSDGSSFQVIGEVKGAGTSVEPQHYSFLDKSPNAGVNYYRLNQVAFDGAFEYSPIESVVYRKAGEIAIYPTIPQSELYVELPENAEQNTDLKIYSIRGELVLLMQLEGTGRLSVALPEMVKGQYLVEVVNGGTFSRQIIFKQ